MELDYVAEYHTTSEHLLPLSLSFLPWALKKVLLSGIVFPVPWMPGCPPSPGEIPINPPFHCQEWSKDRAVAEMLPGGCKRQHMTQPWKETSITLGSRRRSRRDSVRARGGEHPVCFCLGF